MENFENFKTRNQAFGAYWCKNLWEKEMEKCYQIALDVEKTYNENHGNITEPQVGDVVEFRYYNRVYEHGLITENLYGKSSFGMITVCESGSSFTDGKFFSTSGGAFHSFHKSRLQYVGEDYNVVWTWGCHGSGGSQGIYFPLKVRKWVIPYEPISFRSGVRINGRNEKYPEGGIFRDCVTICNENSFYIAKEFSSVRAFLAWADYVGYKHESYGDGTFKRRSPQQITNKCVLDLKDLPEGCKPIKVLGNGYVRDGWVYTTDTEVWEIWLNNTTDERLSDGDYRNPMGV